MASGTERETRRQKKKTGQSKRYLNATMVMSEHTVQVYVEVC